MTGDGTTPLIAIEGLRAERQDADRRFRLTVPNFQLRPGDRVAVLGPSGSGKSTFIETIACARAPAAAQAFLVNAPDGAVDVAGAWADRREPLLTRLRARAFGYVQQTGGLLEFLSVRDNIALSQRLAGRADPDWIDRLGRELGIDALFRSPPARLSGGQRQRVAIARALAHRPSVVIADEPTASLDRGIARVVMGLLCRTTAEAGAALLVATHDLALVEEFAFAPIGLTDDGSRDAPDGALQAVTLSSPSHKGAAA
ncbi:ABC transporter ATP-binding protein [Azospirillum doebereinerae]|uniref:ATP-binding cassette domain-containing protein n=1 Tax=Azospirillum doebereinerae TaxID=92933 RepID=A0A3S0XK29_9PROT|nr:ATP-binding cassette domain-containing protein [Azospirillum doebereinerae]RUQ66360.1 ATP-binding cassette domain-containing protein [Azospirillum doebereinerae]